MDHVKAVRQKWFSVACCPPNVARTLASLGQYIYAQEENAVCIHQFISSTAKAVLESGTVEIGMESTLLQDSKVKIQTRQDSEVTFKIRRLRICGETGDYSGWPDSKGCFGKRLSADKYSGGRA
ncbi:MAG: hypothetical protein ACLR6I_19840 [Waltera sp.]